ncbi:MAG: GNAT family N-acetyltransferase [Roseateles sp.]|nr:MAG: GNAT family N-acetyltransferase [Roseateles sp.]
MTYELRELRPDDGCNALSLGDPAFAPLKTFLRKEAKKLHREDLAKTFVLVETGQNRVLAYVTTLCTHVSVQQFDQPDQVEDFRYKDYPAIKLARLAVHAELQGSGAGSQLVDFVIGLAIGHVMPHTGCRFLVVDAKAPSIGFYERKGFSKMGVAGDGDQAFTTMFIDLHRLNLG